MPSRFPARRYRGRVPVLACALFHAAPVLAEEPQADTRFSIGDIVVTARPADGVLTSVDTLGGDAAQRQLVDNSWELFARLPGVVLTDFDQGTTSGRFSIRGFNGEGEINAVKLLIDGIPANDNAGGMPFIDAVPSLDIAGIELVRGTADPRWGLHAIAGSAGIATRIGGTYADARLATGAFGVMDGQLSAGIERGGFSQNYTVGYRSTDGFRDHGGLERVTLAGKWFYRTGGTRVGAIVRHSVANAEEPGYLSEADASSDRRHSYPISATDGGRRRMEMYALLLDSDLASGLTLATRAYRNILDDDRYVRFSATVAQQRRLTGERHDGGSAVLRYRPAGLPFDLLLEAGGDVQVQHDRSRRWTTDRRVLGRQTRDQDFDLTVYGGYVQAVIQPVRWLTVTPGWRWDRVAGSYLDRLTGTPAPINDYGTISQPKLAVAVTPAAGVTLYGNYGRTFQIGVGAASYLVPPRIGDVAPSINEGVEAGVKLAPNRHVEARVALWQQTASGELRRRLNDPSGDVDNLGATRRRGVDMQLSVRPIDAVSLWGSYSYQRAVIRIPAPATPSQAGNDIDHVPRNVFSGGIDVTATSRLRLSLWGNGQSSYQLDPANSQGRWGDYVAVTAEVALRVAVPVELSAQVRNLGGARYGYVWYDGTQRLFAPADPRALFVAARLRL